MDGKLERELIEASKQDTEAFGKLYDHYYNKIFGYILRRTLNVEISMDVTSDTFFKALHSIHKFDFKKGTTFSPWLYKIATNCYYQYFRNEKNNRKVDLEKVQDKLSIPSEEIEKVESEINNSKEFKKVKKILNQLDEKYQTIVHLRFWEDLNYEEISFITGINKGTLKSHLSRALDLIRNKLNATKN